MGTSLRDLLAPTTPGDPLTTLQITALPIGDVRPHPQNVRRELRGVDELADSIKAEGLHQPIVVAPDGDTYVVVMGNSRHAAASQLGWETIPCIIRTDLNTETKVLSAMLAENCARNDLTLTEEGDAFQRLLDLDLSAATVAKRAGRSRKQVADRITVASQPEKVRQAVDDRQITLTSALALAELEDDHELYTRVEQSLGTPRFDYEVKRAAAIRANIKAEHDQRAELIKAGYVEATEKELSSLDKPVGGYKLERIWHFTPDQPEQSLRFTIFNPNPEYYGPGARWYRLAEVEPESDDQPADGDTPTTAETATADSERTAEADALALAREAAAQERKTAADRRRAYLNQVWEQDLAYAPTTSPNSVTKLLRDAISAGSDGESYMESRRELVVVIDPDSPDLADDDPRLDPRSWSAAQLQFAVWWLMWAVGREYEVSNLHPNMWDEDTHTYLETLRDVLEYELSDIEDALLDTYHALTDGDGDD